MQSDAKRCKSHHVCYTLGMSVTKAITVRLDPADYQRLVEKAKEMGVSPGTLGRVYVRAGLTGNLETERKRRAGLEALERLARLTADLPSIDAVQIARESREDLERRPEM